MDVGGRTQELGHGWFERARAVGEAHGFFTLESKACLGLGHLAMLHMRKDEAVQLLQNSLKAAECKGVPGQQRPCSVSHFTAARHTEEQVRCVPQLHSSLSDTSPTVLPT